MPNRVLRSLVRHRKQQRRRLLQQRAVVVPPGSSQVVVGSGQQAHKLVIPLVQRHPLNGVYDLLVFVLLVPALDLLQQRLAAFLLVHIPPFLLQKTLDFLGDSFPSVAS